MHLKQRLLYLLHQSSSTTHFNCQSQILQFHALLITTGLHESIPSSLPTLLRLYASNSHPSSIHHASLIFRSLRSPDIHSCNAIIRQLASSNNPLHSLTFFHNTITFASQSEGINNALFPPDPFICASIIKACGRLMAVKEGKSVHAHVLRFGLASNLNVQNTLIHFYLNSSLISNSFSTALNLFDRIPQRTVVTVNSMISGLLKNKLFDMGLSLFNRVLGGDVGEELKPNDVTLVILVSGCAELGSLGVGMSLHSYCCKTAVDLRNTVCNALIDLYMNCGQMGDAVVLFENVPCRDLVSWNTMIAGYCMNNHSDRAISLFKEMKLRDLDGDRVTWVSLISACSHSRDLEMGRWIHSDLKRRGTTITVPIATALINMYSKCGLIETARTVFNEMTNRNIVSWNSMILAYVEQGFFTEAFILFDLIKSEMVEPDEVTMLGLVTACRNFGALNHGRQIHSYIVCIGLHKKDVVCNALIDMYAKCGSMNEANRLFNQMPEKDVISWTSMIVGHAINGEGKEAVFAFQQMRASGVEPNGITFIGILSACDHAGLVEDGQDIYEIMCKEYSIEPEIEHCGCMVDILSRAGLLDEAYNFVKSMPVQPNAVIWRMLIGACRIHGDVDLGASLVEGLLELKKFYDPEDYVISSNIFATAGRWNDAMRARKLMFTQKVHKVPGKSLVLGIT